MSAIKVVLIVVILALLGWALRNRKRVGMRAGARIMAALLGAFAVVSILDPGLTTTVAEAVGVGRGADLLLYVLVIAFGFTSVGFYLRSCELERRIDGIVRMVAIRDATQDVGGNGSATYSYMLPSDP